MEENRFQRKNIVKRLNQIKNPRRIKDTLRRLSYEFGVNPELYNPSMSKKEIADTTYINQKRQSPLERDIIREFRDYEEIRQV
jgi:hypothetical protein